MDNYETLLNKLANLLNQQEDKRKLHEIENKIFLDKDALKLITNYQKAQEDYNKLYLKISEPTLYLEKEIHKILDLKDHEKC